MFCYVSIIDDEWVWLLVFIIIGGSFLGVYDEYKKVVVEGGLYKVVSRWIVMWYRLGIGVIVSDGSLCVKFVLGGYLGIIEEWFIG